MNKLFLRQLELLMDQHYQTILTEITFGGLTELLLFTMLVYILSTLIYLEKMAHQLPQNAKFKLNFFKMADLGQLMQHFMRREH